LTLKVKLNICFQEGAYHWIDIYIKK